jgi:tetratricopeptide (TPR) repeat protein
MRRVLVLLPFLASLAVVHAGTQAARTRETLGSLESLVKANPDDFVAWNKIADAHLRLLSSTGLFAHLTIASEAVEKSLKLANPEFNRGGLAMRARIELGSHRFSEARQSAEQLRRLMQDETYALQLLGDALFNLGDYSEAERAWNKVLSAGNELAMEPRLSQLDWVQGNAPRARQRLENALQSAEKNAPEFPEVAAWCHVQIGELAFKLGDWEAAESHYKDALLKQPDYYAGLDHLAELRGAEGKIDEAVALYTRVIERVERPEFLQALGDLYLFAARADEAKPWHDRALAGYVASVKRGEILYLHHLASFYSDSVNQPEEAIPLARRDLTLRHSIQAYDALAWALFRAGKKEEALELTAKALATGAPEAHILYHAGMIRMGSGDVPGGRATLQRALEANPRFNTFHVHR